MKSGALSFKNGARDNWRPLDLQIHALARPADIEPQPEQLWPYQMTDSQSRAPLVGAFSGPSIVSDQKKP